MKIDEEKLEELIRRSIQGEEEAQEALVQAVQNKVYYHCKKMLKKEEDTQDATQDVLIVMLSSLSKLREPAAFWGWVNGITANRCRHLLSAPHKEWQIPEDEEGVSLLDKAPNLDETLVPEQALDKTRACGTAPVRPDCFGAPPALKRQGRPDGQNPPRHPTALTRSPAAGTADVRAVLLLR